MECDRCLADNPDDNLFCGKCGAMLSAPRPERLFQKGNLGAFLILAAAVAVAISATFLALMAFLYPLPLIDMWIYDVMRLVNDLQLYVISGLWMLGLALVLRHRGVPRFQDRTLRRVLLGAALFSLGGNLVASTLGNMDIARHITSLTLANLMTMQYLGHALAGAGMCAFLATLAYMLLKPATEPCH